jgi:hypothetical protein
MGKINENNILCVFTMPGVDKDSDIILWRDDEGDGEDTNGYIIITEAIPTGRKDETDGKDIYEASRLARLRVVENDGEYSVDYNLATESEPSSEEYKALNAKVIGILDACQAELFEDYLTRLEA